jgi:hypothetical protein
VNWSNILCPKEYAVFNNQDLDAMARNCKLHSHTALAVNVNYPADVLPKVESNQSSHDERERFTLVLRQRCKRGFILRETVKTSEPPPQAASH